MRLLALFLAALAPTTCFARQDSASPTTAADTVYTFTIEQGWRLTAENERELFVWKEQELTQGLNPVIRVNPNQPPVARKRRSSADSWSNPSTFRGSQGDPLKAEGSVTLQADGKATFAFTKIEYWDASQRWTIEFEREKIKTVELGGASRWRGTREEWSARLDQLEKAFNDKYLRAVTPQRPDDLKGQIGLAPAPQETGRRLYVTQCLEEQLAVLLLSRLDGAIITRTLWPAEVAKYPARAIQIARSLIDRLMLQCSGELTPPKLKASRSRSIHDAPWDGSIAALPTFPWTDGAAWAAEQTKPFEEARKRLSDLATASATNGGIDDQTWNNAITRELQTLSTVAVTVPARPATPQDALFQPRLLAPGKGIFDCKEDLDAKEGRVASDDLEAHGLIKDMDVAYFVSGSNRWHASKIRLETWYHGKVKRQ